MLLSKAGIIDELESTMPRHACLTSSSVCTASSPWCSKWLLMLASHLEAELPPRPGHRRLCCCSCAGRRWISMSKCCSTLLRTRPVACSLLRRLFPRMHARFIHVLRVDPDKLDAVK